MDFASEAVAASDSKGRIHAFWTEKTRLSEGLGQTLLWYSAFDPEGRISRTSQVLDSAPAIYSLGLTMDEDDNAHAVWVSATEGFEMVPNMPYALSDQRRLNMVYYLRIGPAGTGQWPRQSLFGSASESIWVSITSAGNSVLYLAWTSVFRVDRTHEESAVYYATLDAERTFPAAVRTLVAESDTPSRMLRAAASDLRNTLYLAWVDDLGGGRSGITCSSVDLSEKKAKTVRIEELQADVDRLELAPIEDGSVLIGWTYKDPSDKSLTLTLTRLARDEAARPANVNVLLPRDADALESMVIDSRGSIHMAWTEISGDLHIGLGPVHVKELVLHYSVVDASGRFLDEERRPFRSPLSAALVSQNGNIYVLPAGSVVEPIRLSPADGPLMILSALILSVCLMGGAGTEAGAYLLARCKIAPSPSRRLDTGLPAKDFEARLVRRIRARPGIALSELQSITTLGALNLASCLRHLETSGLVRSLRQGTRQRFYCLNPSDQASPRTQEMRSMIIRLVNDEPGIAETDIARRLGMSQQLANYHLRVLSKVLVLSSRRQEGKVRYFVNERTLPSMRRRARPLGMQDVYKWRRSPNPA